MYSAPCTRPALKVLHSAIVDHDSERLAPNLRGLPVLVRAGTEDGSVPPVLTRRMARVLREVGAKVRLQELAGKGHWCARPGPARLGTVYCTVHRCRVLWHRMAANETSAQTLW